MEAKQMELMIQFIKKLPREKFLDLSQMLQAKVFIWFSKRQFGIELNEKEIEDCFKFTRLGVPTKLGSRLRREYDVAYSEWDKFAISEAIIHEFDENYEKFLDVGLPDIDALKVKPPLLSDEEISGGYKNSQAYVLLYFVENSARKWTNEQYGRVWGEDWWQKIDKVTVSDASKSIVDPKELNMIKTHKMNAQVMKNKEKANRLISHEEDDLCYLELGHLIDFIRVAKNFPGNKVVRQNIAQLEACLKTIDGIRNPVAHNRVIGDDNLEILKVEYKKWCRLIPA
jgi:hypothetical protein